MPKSGLPFDPRLTKTFLKTDRAKGEMTMRKWLIVMAMMSSLDNGDLLIRDVRLGVSP